MADYKVTFTFTSHAGLRAALRFLVGAKVFRSAIPSSSMTWTYVPCVEDTGGVRLSEIETAKLHLFPTLRVSGDTSLSFPHVLKLCLFHSFPVGSLLPTHCMCWWLLSHFAALWHKRLGTTSVDEGSARHGEFYLAKHITHNRHISLFSEGFKPAIPKSERPQTYI
jgi:hypothetical protein